MSIYIQCNPLLDISAHVDDSFIKKYDLTLGAASLVTEAQMGIYSDIEQRSDVAYVPGGSGLNTARVAQWLSQQGPAAPLVSYVGCVAHDKYGDLMKDEAAKEGVKMILDYTDKAPSGSCAVAVTGTQRTLVANLGAANHLSLAHVESAPVAEAAAAAEVLYLSGFTLTLDLALVKLAAARAHGSESKTAGGRKKFFAMNVSAPFLIQFFGAQMDEVLPSVDILFCNDDEGRALAEKKGLATAETPLLEVAHRLSEGLPYEGEQHHGKHHPHRLVVITAGSEPTVYAHGPSQGRPVDVTPIPKDKIVDTNGAGDSFVGGFLAAHARGLSIEKCIHAGNYAAGVIIQADGCTLPEKPTYKLE